MKKLLLTGIAALFLATGTAHAIPCKCERAKEQSPDTNITRYECDAGANGVNVQHTHVSDVELYQIELSVRHWRKKWERAPRIVFDAENLKLTIDGKQCRWDK
jgi:hypothetical protein